MNVVLVGIAPFLQALGTLVAAAGHATMLYEADDLHAALEQGTVPAELGVADVALELQHTSVKAKRRLLKALSSVLPGEALLQTSALNAGATEAAAWVARPEATSAFSVLLPLHSGDTVELAPALQSAEHTLQRARRFWQSVGLQTAEVADGPGLVRARVICCIINEAAGALMEGIASAEDIDRAMQLGTNYPHGPLAWADSLGLDTVLGVMNALFAEWGEDRYRPSPLLRRLVAAGKLGSKSGEGFYRY